MLGAGHLISSATDVQEATPVGQKTVRFSDLSGELITRDDALARIVIHEHPELGDSPVEIEGLAMEAAAFDELATDRPMSELLLTARPARPSRRPKSSAAGPRGVNYDTLEHA